MQAAAAKQKCARAGCRCTSGSWIPADGHPHGPTSFNRHRPERMDEDCRNGYRASPGPGTAPAKAFCLKGRAAYASRAGPTSRQIGVGPARETGQGSHQPDLVNNTERTAAHPTAGMVSGPWAVGFAGRRSTGSSSRSPGGCTLSLPSLSTPETDPADRKWMPSPSHPMRPGRRIPPFTSS